MKISDKIIRAAIKNANRSTFRQRLGAVIFSGNKVHSCGFNKAKSHPITKPYHEFGTIHAEIDALINATEPEGKDILVVRITKTKGISTSKPCRMCSQILMHHKINKVFYIDRKGNLVVENWLQNDFLKTINYIESEKRKKHEENIITG